MTALSVFVALIAGSSLRPQFSAPTLPEPAAWTHATPGFPAHAGRVELRAAAQGLSPGSTPANKKPFHSMWMTRDRPASVTHLSPQSGWFALPASFGAPALQPDRVRWAAPAPPPDDRDVLTRLCVARC
ncbi:hypothetical protein [Mycobacterium interjectum]|uniref:hypothetical protein n=1 Tax=Mycobacterium interjectum TaxID=33895 RepID=UPI0021F27173|nr:hypothetical protein [Mycobacterium interjectum]MCV7092858.1 hypothetical protein [Mycobacterium interjectum]